jgi:hypothetical protein
MTTFTVKKHVFQSAAVATGNGTAMIVAGLGTLGVQVEGITTATVTFEGTIDGATWYSIQAMNVADGTVGTTATADGLFIVSVAGLDQFRARISAWTTGTLTVTGRATSNSGSGGVSADIDVTTMPANVTTSGTVTASAGTVVATLPNGCGTVALQITGTWVGQLEFEGTIDGTNYASLEASNGTQTVNATTGNDIFVLPGAGYAAIRVRASAWTSGTAVITFIASIGAASNIMTSSIPAGTNHIGQVGGQGVTIALTPTVTAGAYTAGDAVGGLLTFTNAGRVSAEGSVLTDVLIVDDAGQDAELELWLFNQTFTAMSDNAAWAPSEADLENCIVVVSTVGSTWRAAGTPSVVNIETQRRIDITGTSLFGQLVTRGTPTYAATDDLTVKVKLLQD